MYVQHRKTVVNTSLEAAWDFIRNPANLNLLTPDNMHFKIETDDKGVLFTDHITYTPPFGVLGKLARHLYIRSELDRIFDHRARRLSEILAP